MNRHSNGEAAIRIGAFRVGITVSNREGTLSHGVDALVDTGAFYSLVPSSILTEIGITPTRTRTFNVADGRRIEMPVGEAMVEYAGDQVSTYVAFGPDNARPLLGAYTLEALALQVDPLKGELIQAELTL